MRMTEECRRVVNLAADQARKRGDRNWSREHVLLALSQLSDEPDIRGGEVLGRLGVDERRVREALDRHRPPGPELDETPLEAGGPPNQRTFCAPEMERVFVHTRWLAAHFGRRAADTEHLLLGVLADHRPEDRVLGDLGVRFEDVYHALTGAPPAE